MSQTTLTDVSLDPILERLTQLTQLEADWDSYGALPVSPVAFVKACQLLIDVKHSLYMRSSIECCLRVGARKFML
ncbi:MAG: hypothetical protein MUE44_17910 [Oscillatoriaceae cyanobacterium Prado104]|jgi:uncharacterized protein YjaG (DUF416 family)|nr:hypothetical protein [Oscillatoriaceae cyanobacterium Prado104]